MFGAVFGFNLFGYLIYGMPWRKKGGVTPDTHDGGHFVKKRHNLPIYGELEDEVIGNIRFIKKAKPTSKRIVLERIVKTEEAAFTEQVIIPPKLSTYDIDWRTLELQAQESGLRLDSLLSKIEAMRIAYEQEEDEIMLLMLAASLA